MRQLAVIAALLFAAILFAAACGDEDGDEAPTSVPTTAGDETPARGIDPADYQSTVDNPLFPLASVRTMVYEGEETDPDTNETVETRAEIRVLDETYTVAGVEVAVVEVKEYEDGELIEITRDYYAQHVDGTVYYFGEDVDDYEGGEVVGHGGAWLAGEGENQPGVFMPPQPAEGDVFEQERAPGVAEDRSTVVAVDQEVTTAAGTFTGCIETEDVDPIGGGTEHKFYCPGVGLVREQSENSQVDLVSYEAA